MRQARVSSSKIALALFDLDGVLLDSWSVAKQAFEIACNKEGLTEPPPLEAFRALMGLPFQRILRELSLPDRVGLFFHQASLDLATNVKPYPGVMEMLAQLRAAGIRIGVLTGKSRCRAVDVLKRTGISNMLDALVTPDDAPGKPAPGGIYRLLDLAGASNGAMFFAGDTVVDMLTARNAGLTAAFSAWGATYELPSQYYDLRFGTPGEVLIFAAGMRNRPDSHGAGAQYGKNHAPNDETI